MAAPEVPLRRLLPTLSLLYGCTSPDALPPGDALPVEGAAKAPSGEYCDGEDNDADGSVDEGCGTCDYLYTRVRSWWLEAECVVEGQGTGRSLYPIAVGSNTYYTWTTLGSFLGAPVVTDKGRLGQQIAVARLNSKAFGIGGLPYHDWDADGSLETVDELLTLADDVFNGFDTTAQVDMFTVIVALNSEGNGLPSFIDQYCARDAEYCDGLDNDGDGSVDESCGCVEVCDGLDNDFDGASDESGADNDRDGFECDDCDDTRVRTYPGAYDVPENGIDDDCDGTDPQYTYDYDSDVQPLWDAYCVSCHSTASPSGGLDLSPGLSYTNIVGVPSTQLPSYTLVQPASTSLSYLYRKIQGNHTAVGGTGGRMPLGGPYLSFSQAGVVGTWITEGAPPSCPDNDGDGWECTDCDDSDPTVFPGAPEVRGDEIDQDCNDADVLYTYGLEQDIRPYLDTWCTSCHGASLAYLGLRLDGDYALTDTVNVPASQLPTMDLIEPGDHTVSYLYHKIAGSHRTIGGTGSRMPQGGPYFLAEILEVFALWIDEGAPTNACDDADGDVWSCSDCNDSDATVHPGADEVPDDGVDQNCDGVDTTGVIDNDGDGFAADQDCNDADATVYPGAAEICNDGQVNDCTGTAGGCGLVGSRDLATADGRYPGATTGDGMGTGVQFVRDMDGDGFDELVLGAPYQDANGTSAGAAYLFFGPTVPTSLTPDATIRGLAAGDGLGAMFSPASDLDGDGAGELLVTIDAYEGSSGAPGTVYIFSDPPTGTVNASTAGASVVGEVVGDELGFSVTGACDMNGDGYGDLLMGAPDSDPGGRQSGGAWLMSGPITGANSATTATAEFRGEAVDDTAGHAVTCPGDMDADGYDDVVISGDENDAGGTDAGAAYLYRGPVSGTYSLSSASAYTKFIGEDTNDGAGIALGGGSDLTGDGRDDLVIAAPLAENAPNNNTGLVYIVTFPSGAGSYDLSAAPITFEGTATSDQAGTFANTGGDFDNDGWADLLIGARRHDGGGTDAGAGFVAYGPLVEGTAYSLAAADYTLVGEDASDLAGWYGSLGGDFNGDGVSDLVLGAPANTSSTKGGTAYLVLGEGN